MRRLALKTPAETCDGCITTIQVYAVELGWQHYAIPLTALGAAVLLAVAVARWGRRAAIIGFIAGQLAVLAVYAALASWPGTTLTDLGLMLLIAVVVWSVPGGAALLLGGGAHWVVRTLAKRRRSTRTAA